MAYTYYARMNELSGSTVSDSISSLDDTSVTSAIVSWAIWKARKITAWWSQPVYPTTNAWLVKTTTSFVNSCLVKFDTFTGRIFFIQGTANQLVYWRFDSSSVYSFFTGAWWSSDKLSRTHTFTTTKRHHVVLRWNTTKEIWVDWVRVANNTWADASVAFWNGGGGNWFSFLWLRNDAWNFWLCSMDEMIIDGSDWSNGKIKNKYSYYKWYF